MAPAPAPPDRKRGGLDLKNPGPKEYIIVGGVVLGLALLYFWWKGKTQSAPAVNPPGGRGSPATATGLSTGDLMAWLRDHAGSPPRRGGGGDHEPAGDHDSGGKDHDRIPDRDKTGPEPPHRRRMPGGGGGP